MTKKKSNTTTITTTTTGSKNNHSGYSSSPETCIDSVSSGSNSDKSNLLSLVTDLYSSCSEDDYFNKMTFKWNLNEKLNTNNFKSNFVKHLDAKDFNYNYVQLNGFDSPVVFLDKTGLDMRTPSKIFTVNDIKTCVGSKRFIDVIDCSTQKHFSMTMKEWCEYYENPQRKRTLNVINLEFSHTKLEDYVEAPLVVRQLDWIETAWPKCLRMSSIDSSNSNNYNTNDQIDYPKVQKYVIMSVAECFTDFHIDMGGTSVWYHILKGEKIFFLIPPTSKNLEIYKQWMLTSNKSNVFLADSVDNCQRIVLQQGTTFMLPSGWIHAVYTSKDSIVFGGNFLHSFNIEMQLKIYEIENVLQQPDSKRYPFYIKMFWFLIERYVHCFTGTTHLESSCYADSNSLSVQLNAYKTFEPNKNSLTKFELSGLNALYEFMTNLIQTNSTCAPDEIIDPDLLFNKFKDLLDSNLIVKNELINGAPFIHWPKIDKKYLKKIVNKELNESSSSSLNSIKSDTRKHVMRNIPRTKGSIKKRLRPQNLPRSNVERRRRVRCHRCEPCTRDDCGECKYCKDMKKFGGTGISKQCCLSKQCLQPLLPTTTTCMACDVIIDRKHENETNIMYECEICFEIYHVKCFKEKYNNLNHVESIVNEDLNNCWQCANCVNKGYVKQEQNYLKFLDSSLQFQLSLNTNMNDSLNTSFTNSSRTNDLFVSPMSSTTTFELNLSVEQPQQLQQPVKKKRHRRTKLEIEQSKQMFKQQQDSQKNQIKNSKLTTKKKTTFKKSNKRSFLTVDSLTSAEKEIILNEFCEIFYEIEEDVTNELNEQADIKQNDEMEKNESIEYDNSSIDNNYSMSTQNTSSLEVISDTELEEFENNEFTNETSQGNNQNNGDTNSSAEPFHKMIQAN